MLRKVKLLLLILFMKVRITVELTWTTEKMSYTSCENKNQLLMWNITKGVNERIIELQWFFNETTLICLHSEKIGFFADKLYDGRVEWNGTTGILLKNISLSDTGNYTLYVKLAEEEKRHFQDISLTVDEEEVLNQCKPVIKIHQQNNLYCSTACLDKPQLSSEWIINDTQGIEVLGSYITIDAAINEQALCCLRSLKCHDEELKFCIRNPIPSIKATDSQTIIRLITSVIMVATILFVIVGFILWRKNKSYSLPFWEQSSNKSVPIQSVERGFVNIPLRCENMSPDVVSGPGTVTSILIEGDTDSSDTSSDYEDAVSSLTTGAPLTGLTGFNFHVISTD